MGSYGRMDEDLDEYEDDFIDDQDGGDVSGYRYAGEEDGDEYEEEEEEEEEVKEEPVSEEALKLLKYRQKLKEQARNKLRQENGAGSSRDQVRKPMPMNNFGSFFGPSKPVIAERVIQESKALLETRHLAPKASSSQNNLTLKGKGSMPSSSGTKNVVGRQPSASQQVKSKVQLIKQTRDYSFLLSDDADAPKPSKEDPRQQRIFSQKLDARPYQGPAKSNGSSAQSGRKVVDEYEQRKPFGSSQVCSTRAAAVRKLAPDNRASKVSSDSRAQLDLRKQPQLTKKIGSGTGNGTVRPPVARPLPQKKPSSLNDRQMPSDFVERNASTASTSSRAPPVRSQSATNGQRTHSAPNGQRNHSAPNGQRNQSASNGQRNQSAPNGQRNQPAPNGQRNHPAPNGQRVLAEKFRSLGVTKPMEQKRSVQQSSDNRVFKRVNVAASKVEVRPPKQRTLQANLDRGNTRVQKPQGHHSQAGGVRKVSNIKKRIPEEDDALDFRSEIRKMFGYNPARYRDDDDTDDMEADFDTIRREELRSEKIARQEDEEELKKIEEEERREAERKAKRRKLNQR